jgi:hypothetical protein
VTLSDYRETYSWQAAIDLGRPLTKLAEELPAQEQQGLIMALQRIMVELPGTIASDLILGTNTRVGCLVRLQAALELTERVYPALDTAEPRRLLDALVARCDSVGFTEIHAAPAPAPQETEDDEGEVVSVETTAAEAPAESV